MDQIKSFWHVTQLWHVPKIKNSKKILKKFKKIKNWYVSLTLTPYDQS